ncbi:MAG TPA: TetR/AcrR family transcriptional regulator [Candidatus Kapabacteria bacterium]|nr:TetR/AcrR family transcriptional regulator [Candidatus Kapabacteria bacterium]
MVAAKSEIDMSVHARILAAAELRLTTVGYSNMTMDELADTLGMSKRTLYEYFGSKDNLTHALIEEKNKEIGSAQEAILASGDNVIEKIFRVGDVVQNCLGALLRSNILNDLKRNSPQAWQKINELRETKIRRLWTEILSEGIRKGFFRKEVNLDIFILALVATTEKVMDPETSLTHKYSIEQCRLFLLDILLNGIVTEKGRKVISEHKLQLS